MGRNERMETNKVMERNKRAKRNQLLWLGDLSRIKPWFVSVAVVTFYGASKGQRCPHSGVCHCLGDSCYSEIPCRPD